MWEQDFMTDMLGLEKFEVTTRFLQARLKNREKARNVRHARKQQKNTILEKEGLEACAGVVVGASGSTPAKRRKCSNCKEYGHNKSTCAFAVITPNKKQKKTDQKTSFNSIPTLRLDWSVGSNSSSSSGGGRSSGGCGDSSSTPLGVIVRGCCGNCACAGCVSCVGV
jgi:uncharacterized membrane protein YgcG